VLGFSDQIPKTRLKLSSCGVVVVVVVVVVIVVQLNVTHWTCVT
jgi:hypothetical protein